MMDLRLRSERVTPSPALPSFKHRLTTEAALSRCALAPLAGGLLRGSAKKNGEGLYAAPLPTACVETPAMPSPTTSGFHARFDGLWGEGTGCSVAARALSPAEGRHHPRGAAYANSVRTSSVGLDGRVLLEHARLDQAGGNLLHLVHQVDRGAGREDEAAGGIALAGRLRGRTLVFQPAHGELEPQGLAVELDALHEIRKARHLHGRLFVRSALRWFVVCAPGWFMVPLKVAGLVDIGARSARIWILLNCSATRRPVNPPKTCERPAMLQDRSIAHRW